jgi:hypothetical protein
MRLVRSWPNRPPDKHPRIYDNCERVYIDTTDYRPLLQLNDNVLHLDWDVAVAQDELRDFARKCQAEPELVRVAPTMSYPTRQRRWHRTTTPHHRWMGWTLTDDRKERILCKPGDPFCHVSSFGVIYLPRWSIEAFCEALETGEYGPDFLDFPFCYWHHVATGGRGIPIEWNTNAIHINFSMKETLCDL